MIQELTAGDRQHPDFLTRLLTPIIRGSGRRLLRFNPAGSLLLELPNGQKLRFGKQSGAQEPYLRLQNYSVIHKALRRGGLGFAEAYLDGTFDCSDLTALFQFFIRNRKKLETSGGSLFKSRLIDRIAHLQRRNTRVGSRRNISEHYDLGNTFYRAWLDHDMNYSSGLYADRDTTLQQAQSAKLALVLDALELEGGERVLEIGCGWGSFAKHAASLKRASVIGITLSHEQLAYAQEIATKAGLEELCEFRLQDYRDTAGQFDRIVSIEMIEAVGEENWPRYFQVLQERLKPQGSAVIQSITIDEAQFPRYRRKADFIQRYIFPGGMLPTPCAIHEHAEAAGLRVNHATQFGQSYARTLRDWRHRFEAAWPGIERLGFDERFRRKWLYYLTYCEAGFLEGVIDVGIYRLRKT